MLLIVEAGSTKTDIAIINKNEVQKIKLQGMNPCTHPGSESAMNQLDDDLKSKVLKIQYYGAGVEQSYFQNKIKAYLHKLFFNCTEISVKSDLYASVDAFNDSSEYILCLMGTGSNVSLISQNKAIQKVPSPGYVFDDPGSAYQIGKYILNAYLFQEMSLEDRDTFDKLYYEVKDHLVQYIYAQSKVNTIVAGFSMFLKTSSAQFKNRVLSYTLGSLIKLRVERISDSKKYKFNFTGSIAYEYSDFIKAYMEQKEYNCGAFIKSPIEKLIENFKIK